MEYRIDKERTHLFAPSICVSNVFTIDRQVSEEKLRSALKKAMSAHPVFRCRIKLEKHGAAFFEEGAESEVLLSAYETDWKTIIEEQERIPFDLENGEWIRFFHRQRENMTEVLMLAHHLVGDGMSFVIFAGDIMAALNDRETAGRPLQLLPSKSVPAGCRLRPFLRLMLGMTNMRWRSLGKAFSFAEYQVMAAQYWREKQSTITVEEFSEDEVSKLHRLAMENRISLNSLLTAKYAAGMKKSGNIGISVNLRPDDYKGMGNYATGVSIFYEYDNQMELIDNAKKIHELIYKKLDDDREKYFLQMFMGGMEPTLIDAAYFAAFGNYKNEIAESVRKMFGYRRDARGLNISNLKEICISQEDGDSYHCSNYIFVPPHIPNVEMVIGVCTYQGKMTVCIHS